MEKLLILVGFLLFFSPNQGTLTAPLLETDKQALLEFAHRSPHFRSLNWNERSPVCRNWKGIACGEDGTRVISVRLPAVGFHGPIPRNTLSRLSALRILSLRSNAITGAFPLDFGNLKNLSFLYLQHNNFSGPLPSDFSVWGNLTVVNLSHNKFNGGIPRTLSELSQLTALNLADNSLSGEIPQLNLPNLRLLNLSHNNLSGAVPELLHKFPKSSFFGNNESLMDYTFVSPLLVLPPHRHDPRIKNARKPTQQALHGIVIAGSVLGFLAFGSSFLVCYLRKEPVDEFPGKLGRGEGSPAKGIPRSASNKMTFFEGCNHAFDLEDLLSASAEVLGKGTFGTAYKAILEDAKMVVVKRLKDVSVGKREFDQQMDVIGSIKHENVIELRAYYYSKDEKLIVYDYYDRGSVASMLHGKQGEKRTDPLDWEARVKIALGAAKGIARIHGESSGKLVHGNVKSSNIFLNPQQHGCVSDLGLSTIMAAQTPPIACAAGYRAPEVSDTRKAMQASDVYSFGVVLLELLTGKSPIHCTNGDEMVQLVGWVQSVVREEWTAEVFEMELVRYPEIEEDLVEMLQIAMSCVVRMPEQRPKMAAVVRMIENVGQANAKSQDSTPSTVG